MALRKLERINYGGKWPVSIKYQNLHSFKEGLILLCQSILETRRITNLHGSAHFTIPLRDQISLLISSKRSSHRSCSVENGVRKNFANFTGIHLCWSLFLIKLQTQACNFIKRILKQRSFSVKFEITPTNNSSELTSVTPEIIV